MTQDEQLKELVNKIYLNIAPAKAGDNIIVYQKIGEKTINALISISLWQVSVYCKDVEVGDKIKERLIQLYDKWMDKENGVQYCFVESVDDLYYQEFDETGIHLTLRVKQFKQSTSS